MEDARFTLITDDDGTSTYIATYTGFDGVNICQRLLQTDDLVTFTSSPITGYAAVGKGLTISRDAWAASGLRCHALTGRRTPSRSRPVALADTHDHPTTRAVVGVAADRQLRIPNRDRERLSCSDHPRRLGPLRTYHLGVRCCSTSTIRRSCWPGRWTRSCPPRRTPARRLRAQRGLHVWRTGTGDVLVLPFGIGDQSIRHRSAVDTPRSWRRWNPSSGRPSATDA